MSITSQSVIELVLVGDGTSTSFTYSFNTLYETILGDGVGSVTSADTLPSSVSINSTDGSIPSGGTASLDGFGNLVLSFPSGWTGSGRCFINLEFNSGTLSGTTAAWTSATASNTTWTLPLNGNSSVMVGFVVSGTITAGTILFEVSQ